MSDKIFFILGHRSRPFSDFFTSFRKSFLVIYEQNEFPKWIKGLWGHSETVDLFRIWTIFNSVWSLLHFATFCLVISSLCSNGFCMLDILDNFWPLMRVSMDHSQKAVLIAILHNFIFAKNLRKKWITQRDFNEGYFLKWDKKFINFIGGKIPT